MSGDPLLGLKGDTHERLEVTEPERGAVTPGTGLILERTGKGSCEERSFLHHILPNRRFDVPHRSEVAGRLDKLLVAMVFPPCVK